MSAERRLTVKPVFKRKKVTKEVREANTQGEKIYINTSHLRDLPRAENTGKAGMSSGLTKAQ